MARIKISKENTSIHSGRIFISYKRTDYDKVVSIKDRIESELLESCWFDLDGIESRHQFRTKICNAIDNAKIVLFMYSKAHLNIDFENDWTIKELDYAQAKKKIVVLINIDHTPLDNLFLLDFGSKNNINISDELQFQKLLSDIRSWLRIPNQNKSPQTKTKSPHNDIAIDSGNLQSSFNLTSTIKVSKKLILFIVIILAIIATWILYNVFSNTSASSDMSNSYTINLTPKWSLSCSKEQKKTINEILSNMVKVTENLYVCKYEVTVAEWVSIMGYRPETHSIGNYPVQSITDKLCSDFLLKIQNYSGINFNIPSTREWLIAAKGNDASSQLLYAGSDNIDEVSWYLDNCNNITHPVGVKSPNALGLYDMSGNVWETCYDEGLGFCTQRGGSFSSESRYCQILDSSGDSIYIEPIEIGIRLVINNKDRFEYRK